MARNEMLKKAQYEAIQTRYEQLGAQIKGKQKHFRILVRLQQEFFLTFRALEYIIFREYEKKEVQNYNPNQLTIYDLGA